MTKLARMVVLAVALVAIFGGTFGGTMTGGRTVEAANGYEQWVGPFDDGCYYYWDGFAYTVQACPRTDGGVDFGVDGGNGQWAYVLTVWTYTDGSVWVYYDGIYYAGGLPTSTSSGTYGSTAVIGAPSWSGLTDNVMVNQILIDSNNRMIDNILAPSCIEIVGNVCYY